MVTEREIIEAIRECERDPMTGAKRSTLADLYIIYDHLFAQPAEYGYSGAAPVENNTIKTNGDTEFLAAVNGKDAEKVWRIIGKAMGVIQSLHPKMYRHLMDDINDL